MTIKALNNRVLNPFLPSLIAEICFLLQTAVASIFWTWIWNLCLRGLTYTFLFQLPWCFHPMFPFHLFQPYPSFKVSFKLSVCLKDMQHLSLLNFYWSDFHPILFSNWHILLGIVHFLFVYEEKILTEFWYIFYSCPYVLMTSQLK